ncbi:hypothetical protein SASPL_124119 [Salvia splendens]|uniref:Replication protein A 70 kDa DNA-binding subunit B/D first OB fold domain-containing protein n=1 Tax=Salvia splendens TaxID=180675 RepID=A0A8X8ZUN0_SALSN|nr:hypothetical protein SASPL_124119 [Salvia splendens]
MSPFVTCLTNLSKAITTSTIKVRCVRRYEGVPEDKNDNSLECVLHDNEGTRIQASFTNNIMKKMASPLREDVIGVITNPGRVLKQSKYRLIEIEISDEQIEGDERFICNGSLGPVGPNISSEFENLTVK